MLQVFGAAEHVLEGKSRLRNGQNLPHFEYLVRLGEHMNVHIRHCLTSSQSNGYQV